MTVDTNVMCALADNSFSAISNCIMVNALGADFTMILIFIFMVFAFLIWMGKMPMGVAIMMGLGVSAALGLMNPAFNGIFIIGCILCGGLFVVGLLRSTAA